MPRIEKIYSWIEKNRYLVLAPLAALVIWITAIGCEPAVPDPLEPAVMVNARELAESFQTWQTSQAIIASRFEFAGQDLKAQAENNLKIQDFILSLASGGAVDLPGLLQLLFAGGALGAITDNIRKRGVIAGLKRNK